APAPRMPATALARGPCASWVSSLLIPSRRVTQGRGPRPSIGGGGSVQYIAHLRGEAMGGEAPASAQGGGPARRAWDSYDRSMREALTPVFRPVAVNAAASAMGFWLVWHLHGGFDGLRDLGMPRRTIYWNVKKFQAAYGVHPDEFECPGVTIDLEQ